MLVSQPGSLAAYLTMPRDAAGRYDTANQRAAKVRSAERRKCPSCQRKGAMVKAPDHPFARAYCRWCGYTRPRDDS